MTLIIELHVMHIHKYSIHGPTTQWTCTIDPSSIIHTCTLYILSKWQ